MMDRRPRAVARACFWVGADQVVEVARFEFVGIGGEYFQIANAIQTGTGFKRVAEGESREHGVAAGAAAADDAALWVDQPLGCEMAHGIAGVLDIGYAPALIERLAIGSAKTAAAAVVEIEDRKTATTPILDFKVEGAATGSGGPAVTDDDQRRLLALGDAVIGMGRWVEKPLYTTAISAWKQERLWRRQIGGCERRLFVTGHGFGCAGS